MTQPTVSVIIAAYNVEQYIVKAILSALSQQDVDLEVIFIDDASSDKTLSLTKGITDSRLVIVQSPKNTGPGAARNLGINAAKGKWIAILDGDDEFLPNRLSRCLKLAESRNAHIVVDNLLMNYSDGQQKRMFTSQKFLQKPLMTLQWFIEGNSYFLGGSTLGYLKPVISRDFLIQHQIRYDEHIRIGEDYLLMADALAVGAVCCIDPSGGYLYNVRVGSTSHRLQKADIERIIYTDETFTRKHSNLKPEIHAVLAKRRRNLDVALKFTALIDSLKERRLLTAVWLMISSPSVAIELRRPVYSKLRKIFRCMSSKEQMWRK